MTGKKISSPKFEPRTDLSPDDLEAISVTGFGQASGQTLRRFGWNGGCAGTIGLALGPDNKRILATHFNLLGAVHESETGFTAVKAQRFWPTVPQTWELRLPLHDLSIFRFDGSLVSSWVASQSIDFEVFNLADDVTVPQDEFEKIGGGHFSLRACAYMTTSIWLKVHLLILPLSKDTLFKDYACAAHHLFPGLKLANFDVAMLPNATKPFGLAFFPLLQKGDSEAAYPQMPSFEMREAVSKFLQRGTMPKVMADHKGLLSKLKRIEESGADALTPPASTAALRWPDAKPSPQPTSVEASEGNTMFCQIEQC